MLTSTHWQAKTQLQKGTRTDIMPKRKEVRELAQAKPPNPLYPRPAHRDVHPMVQSVFGWN